MLALLCVISPPRHNWASPCECDVQHFSRFLKNVLSGSRFIFLAAWIQAFRWSNPSFPHTEVDPELAARKPPPPHAVNNGSAFSGPLWENAGSLVQMEGLREIGQNKKE